MKLEITGEWIRSQFHSYALNSRKAGTWHRPVHRECVAARQAHNGSTIIGSPAPFARRTMGSCSHAGPEESWATESQQDRYRFLLFYPESGLKIGSGQKGQTEGHVFIRGFAKPPPESALLPFVEWVLGLGREVTSSRSPRALWGKGEDKDAGGRRLDLDQPLSLIRCVTGPQGPPVWPSSSSDNRRNNVYLWEHAGSHGGNVLTMKTQNWTAGWTRYWVRMEQWPLPRAPWC